MDGCIEQLIKTSEPYLVASCDVSPSANCQLSLVFLSTQQAFSSYIMEYLEYAEEEEDDNLFGSDREDNAEAGPSSLPTFNPAKPLTSKAQSLLGSLAVSGARKGKERAYGRDPQDRLDELRFMRMYKSAPHTGKGARSLKHITQDGMLTTYQDWIYD